MVGALLMICIGTSLFKGNLQVMVGNLYDDPKYASQRDAGFSIFYMAINIGALFAPTAALKIMDWAKTSLGDRKSTRLNSSHANISYAVFCLKKTLTFISHQ